MKATTQRDNKLRMTQRLSWASLAAREGHGAEAEAYGEVSLSMNTSLSACVSTWSVCGCLYLSLSTSLSVPVSHSLISIYPLGRIRRRRRRRHEMAAQVA